MVLWDELQKSVRPPPPDWLRIGAARARTEYPSDAHGFLPATGKTSSTGLLLLGTLTTTSHITTTALVNQSFIKLGSKSSDQILSNRVCTQLHSDFMVTPLNPWPDKAGDKTSLPWRAWDRAPDQQQVTFGRNADDFKGLHGHLLATMDQPFFCP